jgi:hypothetical protein
MPDPNGTPNIPDSPTVPNPGFGAGSPEADLSFDDIFGIPNDALVVTAPTTATTNPGEVPKPNSEPAPQAPAPQSWELKTPTGTVYKSQEEAIKGIAEKDTLIETLRQEAIARTGIDPVTRRPAGRAPEQPRNYLQDPASFTKDLRKAVESNDDMAYAQANMKLLADFLSPIEPLITSYAQQKAMDSVTKEIQEFQSFRNSADYSGVLDKVPALKQAIQVAESDVRLSSQLPELYKVAYWSSQGLKTPDLIAAARAQAQPVAAPTPQRTPMQGTSTLAPAPPSAAPTVSTSEGRKALIAQFEANGGLDLKF